MSDIWQRVALCLAPEIDQTISRLREAPEFVAMGSEIERAMAAYFVVLMKFADRPVVIGPPVKGMKGYFLSPQHPIGKYRVDFLFSLDGAPMDRSIVIECDGHEWHEKTKEQAAKDKARDRYLSSRVGKVIHFTGSEIFRDVFACWTDVKDVLLALGYEANE